MSQFTVQDTSQIITPGLLVFREQLDENLQHMIQIAGDAARLRPHCKTHKTQQVVSLQLEHGIDKHKAATFAEAEMLAETGVKDILLAYSLVGANVPRAVKFVQQYPDIDFYVTADHRVHIETLSAAMSDAGTSIGVLLDIDTGQHRTGIVVGDEAAALYQLIHDSEGLVPGGLHVYDGHQHQESRDERKAAIDIEWDKVIAFRDGLRDKGLDVSRIVAGGTASFPVYAEKDDPSIELSPGTCVYNDGGYSSRFPDMVFPSAVRLLTRVISRPTSDRITLDLGYKAAASDPPAGHRFVFPDLPDAKEVLQNEEHLVLETSQAENFAPGDEVYAIPWHICPTSALHKQIYVVADGEVVDAWPIASRDRWLTI